MSANNLKLIKDSSDGWRTRYRYSVFEHRLTFDGQASYARSFIVLKNQYDVIVHFTSFHNYIGTYEKNVYVPMGSDVKAKMHYVCAALNCILISNYNRYRAEHVFDISKEMLDAYFQDYAIEKLPDGRYRSRQSIEKCVAAVASFFRALCRNFDGYMSVTIDELYVEGAPSSRRGRSKKTLTPNFKVRGAASLRTIFRDIPTTVFQVIINEAFIHTPEIAFAICLQAFAGLRPGEVCNIRQEHSPLGSGLIITTIEGIARKIELDLSAEYVLRSDGVRCGGIKTKRRQCVYPAFLPAFCKAYEFHKGFLGTGFESEYCPMFVGRSGKAMTYHDYRSRFQRLVKEYVRPSLLEHSDPECRLYGQLLWENKLGPHSLRHWFSVQLVLMGEDVAGLQYWRGDKNPESALVYLQNKGDLMRELSAANNLFADFLVARGGLTYEE